LNTVDLTAAFHSRPCFAASGSRDLAVAIDACSNSKFDHETLSPVTLDWSFAIEMGIN